METPLHPKLVQPRVHLLFSNAGHIAEQITQWFDRAAPFTRDAFGEESTQIQTTAASDGTSASLHDLRVREGQTLHVHASPSQITEDTLDSRTLQQIPSRRFLFAMTADKPGRIEWFEPMGELSVSRQIDVPMAKGNTRGIHREMTIPPYSCFTMEMAGGVHRFEHIRAFSYHPFNLPKADTRHDDLSGNTIAWLGRRPAQRQQITMNEPMLNIKDSPAFERFCRDSKTILTSLTAKGPNPDNSTSYSDRFLDSLRVHYPLHGSGQGNAVEQANPSDTRRR